MAGSSNTPSAARVEFLQLATARGLTEEETEDLWPHCAHLSHDDILRLYDGFLIGKDSERNGIIRMLDAGVSVAFFADIGCDPRYYREPPRGYYGVLDAIAMSGKVSVEYALAVGEAGRSGEDVALLLAAGVSPEYVLATRRAPAGTVADCWRRGIAAEYVTEVAP